MPVVAGVGVVVVGGVGLAIDVVLGEGGCVVVLLRCSTTSGSGEYLGASS